LIDVLKHFQETITLPHNTFCFVLHIITFYTISRYC